MLEDFPSFFFFTIVIDRLVFLYCKKKWQRSMGVNCLQDTRQLKAFFFRAN